MGNRQCVACLGQRNDGKVPDEETLKFFENIDKKHAEADSSTFREKLEQMKKQKPLK